jgi:hypothetical protein
MSSELCEHQICALVLVFAACVGCPVLDAFQGRVLLFTLCGIMGRLDTGPALLTAKEGEPKSQTLYEPAAHFLGAYS